MLKVKANKHLLVTAVAMVLPLIGFYWLKQTGYFDNFFIWANSNFIFFSVIVFLIKSIGYVYPPIPGGIITLGAIPIIGWVNAYLLDLLGSVFGSIISYYLGRRYGYSFLEKIMDTAALEKVKSLKIKKQRELESIFMFRVLAGGVAEVIAYAAGILRIGFRNFLVGTIASHLVVGIPVYYLAQNIFSTSNALISIVLTILFVVLLFKLKGRYFE